MEQCVNTPLLSYIGKNSKKGSTEAKHLVARKMNFKNRRLVEIFGRRNSNH